jgi:SAM-dependent methyltransferase
MIRARLLEHPRVYRLWQAPFANAKFAPIEAHNDMSEISRVLDVGCGPAINSDRFPKSGYLGVDINDRYVEFGRRVSGREFIAADATTYSASENESHDFVLVNSLLHHLPSSSVRRLLSSLASLLSPDGHIHVLELVRPERRSAASLLARMDRGAYARSIEEWREIFEESFKTTVVHPFSLNVSRVTLWNMVYFKGSVS